MARRSMTPRERLEYRTNLVLNSLRTLENCINGGVSQADAETVLTAIRRQLAIVENTFKLGRRTMKAGFKLS